MSPNSPIVAIHWLSSFILPFPPYRVSHLLYKLSSITIVSPIPCLISHRPLSPSRNQVSLQSHCVISSIQSWLSCDHLDWFVSGPSLFRPFINYHYRYIRWVLSCTNCRPHYLYCLIFLWSYHTWSTCLIRTLTLSIPTITHLCSIASDRREIWRSQADSIPKAMVRLSNIPST